MSEVTASADLAKVVHILGPDRNPFQLVINRGARDGLKPGQRYLVFGYGPEVSDPESGESLGRVELVRGRGEVAHLQDNLATIRSIEVGSARRGKRVIRDVLPFGIARTGIAAGLGQVIEEDWPADSEQPFRDVQLGDLARPI
jgi:hypothetical protein